MDMKMKLISDGP